MKKLGPTFLDTGIFIAFLDRSDRHHPAAVDLFSEPPRRWYTSLVVSEAYGWFLHRLGEDAARTFRLTLGDLPHLELLVLIAKLGITEVWGTDRDLALEGARVLPIGR